MQERERYFRWPRLSDTRYSAEVPKGNGDMQAEGCEGDGDMHAAR